jgi:hypothetical protein
MLLGSRDGRAFEQISVINEGDGHTAIAVAHYQPDPNGFLTRMGGVLSRKRAALHRVEPDRLVRLSDLPSSSDTSYARVIVRDDALYIDYYTSRIDRDWP